MIENGEIAVKTVVLSKDRRKVIRGNPNYVVQNIIFFFTS